MKILITGSHFTPAQATINELIKNPKIGIVYLGRKFTREGDKSVSPESQILPKLGVKYISITTGRLQRNLSIFTITSLFKIPVGFVQSFYYLSREKPDVVLSFGGYVGVPVVICSWLLSIPVMIHEQTLVTGLANRISSWFASKIAVSFDTKYDFPKKRIVITGNPLRQELMKFDKTKLSDEVKKIVKAALDKDMPLVLVTGGNQGSHIINQAIFSVLDQLTNKYLVIHQTGDSKFNDYEQGVNKLVNLKDSRNYLVKKWLDVDELGFLYQHVNLVICRAGINTLLELQQFKIKNIVIPIKGHYEQNFNAKYFADLGLSYQLKESELTGENLLETIRLQIHKRTSANHSTLITHSDAAKRLALETEILAQKSYNS